MFANVGPAWRSSREVPSCTSAHAFSQLSHRTHRLSSISSTSVPSPSPWPIKKLIRLPGSGSVSRCTFFDRRSSTRASIPPRNVWLRLSTSLNVSANNKIVSQLTAARTVAERLASDDSNAISPI